MSEIVVGAGTTDFSSQVLSGVDTIRFTADDSTAIFDAGQFDGVQILDAVVFDGGDHLRDDIQVNNAHRFDVSGWDFINWNFTRTAIILNGTALGDRITGGDHQDVMHGGDGPDRLYGGRGIDKFVGGRGHDTFIFKNVADSAQAGDSDVIEDFKPGRDKIDLHGIDAVSRGSDDAFSFIDSAAFSGTAGELRVQRLGNHLRNGYGIEGDVNGDGVPDFFLLVLTYNGCHYDNTPIHATDFIL